MGRRFGGFMDVDPVQVIPVSDCDAVRQAIIEVISKGNPIVPAPTSRTSFPKPVVLKYAKVKSWSAFEKHALLWMVEKKDGIYRIQPGRRGPERGWVVDSKATESLPPGATLDTATQRLTSLMQLAAENIL
jgi:hypothetical protein